MATNVKLGARPKTFPHTVKFLMLDGSTGMIDCLFKYRTRDEFGEMIDEMMEQAGMTTADNEDGKFSMRALMDKTAGANATYVMKVLDGWGMDVPLSHENVQSLANELPAAVLQIMEDYRRAVTEGRLGNL